MYEEQIETLLQYLKTHFEDAKKLEHLPPLPFIPGIGDLARANDLGVWVAVGYPDAPALVDFFLRACRIEGDFFWYQSNTNEPPNAATATPLSEYDEPGTDRDFDTHAADVQNGYGYYDDAGMFHYYPGDYWD